ncbi:unnamed protein product [Lactuca virosa]|uniref:CCR4-NOT transcription complex subunit 11 n=1 Tax=Lactuca virosa TaxID=75947 RepID=A0AAU9P3F2_9ASTR|nr:unnamed protein product [Lactuca virosa]
MEVVRANLPLHVYRYIDITVERIRHLEELRICSLGVIVRLVQVEDTNTPEIIRFLLETQTFPICLRCIDVGSELAKKGAAFVVTQILMSKDGQQYIGMFPNRFYGVAVVLRKTVDRFGRNQPNSELLKQILNCYMQLVEVSRLFSSEIKSLEVLLIECS